jgi:hypothetical protein
MGYEQKRAEGIENKGVNLRLLRKRNAEVEENTGAEIARCAGMRADGRAEGWKGG